MSNRTDNAYKASNRGSDHANKPRRLYKNPDKSKLCGVCAGLAEFFDLETWVVRLIAASFLLFSAGSAFIAYFVACFILDPKPGSKNNKNCFGQSNKKNQAEDLVPRQYHASVKEVWKKGKAPAETLQKTETTFASIEKKLQAMESYVTSQQYQLEEELEKIS